MNNCYCRTCVWYNSGCPDLLGEDVSCSILDSVGCDSCESFELCSKCSFVCCNCPCSNDPICDR